MFSLLCEAKFWTLKNDVQIRNTDLSVLRYYDKKEVEECPYFEGKKLYCTQRGTEFILKNKRPFKLRDKLKELEQQLTNNKIVFFKWKNDNILHLILNTGLIIAIGVNTHSKDVYKIMFDKFLIGKLLSDYICDVLSTKTHLIMSYSENQLTVIYFNKPLTKYNPPEKLAKLEPKIHHVDLCGPTGRRLDRKLSCNKLGDTILTWWQSTRNEVYPWSPLVKDEDRANVHVYSLIGTKLELLCFYRTEFDLMSVNFSKIKPNVIWLIEQKVSKKGDFTIEYSSYKIVKKTFKKISFTSISLQTQICCHCVSPDEERLVLGNIVLIKNFSVLIMIKDLEVKVEFGIESCIDGSLILFDEPRGITRLVKSAFIPNLVSWHNDGALIVIANERNQFQFFDLALSCVKAQLLSDEVTPSNLLDLTSYFKTQPILLHMNWNKKANAICYVDKFIPNDHLLLLIFENGPLGVLNLIGGGGLSNDVQNSGLTPDNLIRQYLFWDQSDKALNVMLSLNWNTNGSTCLSGLYHIANHIFRHPFNPEAEIQLESALGSFYAPVRPLNRFTEKEFGNQVHDLTRRFFHLLLRHQLFEKAYCLAIDLSNVDLFVDLYHCAKLLKDEEMALACQAKVEDLNGVSEGSSHSSCSRSLCSCSECYTEDEEDGILPPLPQVSVKKSKASRVPPLPDLNRHNKLRGSAFFNCNATFVQPEQAPSNGFDFQKASTSFIEYHHSFLKSVPKNVDFNCSTAQILTKEFPQSYEIRKSSGQGSNAKSFILSDPNFRNQKNTNASLFRASAIESLYDLPLNLHQSGQSELKRDLLPNRSDPPVSNFGPLKLKSFQNHFHASSTFCPSNISTFDHLSSSEPRIVYNEEKPPLLNPINNYLNSQYQFPKNFPPRLSPYVSPSKHFNNFILQRPLHFVPNAFPRQVLKNMNSAAVKQKVKFSDTVTHIVIPDLSKISIEDETLTSQYKSRNNRNPKVANVSAEPSSDFPHDIERANCSEEFNGQKEQLEEEENNGSIKVIHFGVV